MADKRPRKDAERSFKFAESLHVRHRAALLRLVNTFAQTCRICSLYQDISILSYVPYQDEDGAPALRD